MHLPVTSVNKWVNVDGCVLLNEELKHSLRQNVTWTMAFSVEPLLLLVSTVE